MSSGFKDDSERRCLKNHTGIKSWAPHRTDSFCKYLAVSLRTKFCARAMTYADKNTKALTIFGLWDASQCIHSDREIEFRPGLSPQKSSASWSNITMGHPSASAGWPSLKFSGLVQHESTRKTRSGAASGLEAGVDRLSKGHQQSRIKNTFVLIIFCNFQAKEKWCVNWEAGMTTTSVQKKCLPPHRSSLTPGLCQRTVSRATAVAGMAALWPLRPPSSSNRLSKARSGWRECEAGLGLALDGFSLLQAKIFKQTGLRCPTLLQSALNHSEPPKSPNPLSPHFPRKCQESLDLQLFAQPCWPSLGEHVPPWPAGPVNDSETIRDQGETKRLASLHHRIANLLANSSTVLRRLHYFAPPSLPSTNPPYGVKWWVIATPW